MKRISMHMLFWTVYMVQEVLFTYLWNAAELSHLSINKQIALATTSSFSFLIPKLAFIYLILYVLLRNILKGKNSLWKNIMYIFLSVIGTILAERLIAVYINYPLIYREFSDAPVLISPVGIFANIMDLGYVSGAAIFIKQLRLQLAGKEMEKIIIKEKLETELKFLRNQTNPHFLFNTLNNIYALALKKSDDTPEVVLKLSKLLNFMLYESRKTAISIGDELKILDDYIELERIRYNGRLEISFIREIDNDSEQMAPLLLLSFVENAFKHGASESRFESYIHIDMKLQAGILNFTIENSKENCEKQHSNGNIGLANVRRQLELMYTDYDLKVEDENGRFNVGLMINLNSYAKI